MYVDTASCSPGLVPTIGEKDQVGAKKFNGAFGGGLSLALSLDYLPSHFDSLVLPKKDGRVGRIDYLNPNGPL